MFEFETQDDTEPTEAAAAPESGEADEIVGLLENELSALHAQGAKSRRMGLLLCGLMGAYLSWVGVQMSDVLDPEGVAQAATGLAIEAVPAAGENLRGMVVDGAPELAKAGSQALMGLVPAYRQVLESELTPVIDEVCGILAETSVNSMVASGTAGGNAKTQHALNEGAGAVMKRFDIVLNEALDQPTEIDGPTPRQTIGMSLDKLERVDAGLKRIAAGQGNAKERELILSWISLLQQFDKEAEAAAVQAYKQGERVDD